MNVCTVQNELGEHVTTAEVNVAPLGRCEDEWFIKIYCSGQKFLSYLLTLLAYLLYYINNSILCCDDVG